MNNPLHLPFTTLPGALPGHGYLTAQRLQEREEAQCAIAASLRQAEDHAGAIRAAADDLLAQAKTQAQQVREQALREGERLTRQKQEEAIAAAVQWLCHEQDLEQHLADQLAQRWRQLTAQAIEELLGKQDQNALLIRRVNQLVIRRFAQGRLTLSVPPSAMAHAQAAWADSPRIAVTADPTLQEGQALLDDGLLRIHLDSQAQQSRLLQLLRDTCGGRQYA
ncbi:type III secretion protein [Edwardsiella anguillarum]|uniref:type III secretion protein n=1 Tax=Edwardsiella anguillarum TaxID=1821960 RepID=UPI0024B735EA|nr:type III secretion protein [Edwardsiella anguillarum]WHP81101.1 type III secretion protein [Edwardsiella anguillarum]WHQ18602.1 type III secretion protein [Edwardsiella anguillarum]WHQ22143.1 type III secretion protein [Edwardsiella anguillarum]WHQ25666.1 type III secretion protein [Edwardsiella anguillarum]WHQ29189.1 type III secretion protein [Edwardsiella anguillarum]